MNLDYELFRRAFVPLLRWYFSRFQARKGKALIWRYLNENRLLVNGRIQVKTAFGATIEVDGRDFCGRYICYFGVWEPNLTAWIHSHLKPGDCFIDVGANVGYFSLAASPLVGPSGKVIAIEPVARTFDVLAHNLAANGGKNVRAINLAAWDMEATLMFYVSPDIIDGTSTAIPEQAEREHMHARCKVRAATLSSMLTPEEIASARLIKVDVEGAERHVISGFGSMLERGREDLEVIVEISIEAFDEIVLFFRKRGFYPYQLENDYSPAPYFAGYPIREPRQIDVAPNGAEQVDVIFSKINAGSLK